VTTSGAIAKRSSQFDGVTLNARRPSPPVRWRRMTKPQLVVLSSTTMRTGSVAPAASASQCCRMKPCSDGPVTAGASMGSSAPVREPSSRCSSR
jgi:hypothetical protein